MAQGAQRRKGYRRPAAPTARFDAAAVDAGAATEAQAPPSIDLLMENLVDLSQGQTEAALEALATLLGPDLALIVGAPALQPK